MTDQPDRRDLARAAFDAELQVTGYSLPRYARQQIADAILTATLAAVAEELRGQANHHDTCGELSKYPETAAGHHNLAAGFLAAAAHVHSMNRQSKGTPDD